MIAFPPATFPPVPDNVIHPGHPNSLGLNMMNWNLTSFVSTAWPTANKAIYVPFILHRPNTLYKVGWWNGAAAQAGTREVGLYKPDGTKIISGSATAATINIAQMVDVTDTVVEAGLYFLGMSDSGTATLFAIAPTAPLCAGLGVLSQVTASPLPATATMAVDQALAYIPAALLQFRAAL